MDPPTVYASLRAAKTNFIIADRWLVELKALGWRHKNSPKWSKRLETKAQRRKSSNQKRSINTSIRREVK
jgi:hypothetical protein